MRVPVVVQKFEMNFVFRKVNIQLKLNFSDLNIHARKYLDESYLL
jgi:hypothetical protein